MLASLQNRDWCGQKIYILNSIATYITLSSYIETNKK